MNTQETETIELRQLMVAWLMEIAEENGVTLQDTGDTHPPSVQGGMGELRGVNRMPGNRRR